MKKQKCSSRLYPMAAVVFCGLLTMTGCIKEELNESSIPEGAMSITTEKVNSGDNSKTTVDGVAVNWQTDDELVINGSPKQVVVESDRVYITDVDNSVPMGAGFPSSIVTSANASAVVLKMPSKYTYTVASGLQKIDLPMVAYSPQNQSTLLFKHMTSTLDVTVTNTLSQKFIIDSIVVSSDSKPLCGTVTVNPSDMSITAAPDPANDTTKSVKMVFNTEFSVNSSSFKSVQIPVLYTSDASTISVDVHGRTINGAFKIGRIDAAAKINYHNSVNIELGRAKFYPAPCTIRPASGAMNVTYPKFSVSASKKVYFSQGNLQYHVHDNVWQFAANQYDRIGDANAGISSTYDGWIDLFGWGTNGQHTGIAKMPYSTSTTNSDYYIDGVESYNMTQSNNKGDWGKNTIANTENNNYGMWRTLTNGEWVHLLRDRTPNNSVNGTSNVKYALAKITVIGDNKIGLILFPDDVTIPDLGISWAAVDAQTTISPNEWKELEKYGCVFLPCCGYRSGNTVSAVQGNGSYWTSIHSDGENQANKSKAMRILSSGTINYVYDINRSTGCSVRLVQVAD